MKRREAILFATLMKANGGEPSAATLLIVTALVVVLLGASFAWGWNNLGPIFNRYF